MRRYRSKRAVDLLVLVLLAAPALVVIAAAAILVRLDCPGPVFFRQSRVGVRGNVFSILKLRTMIHADSVSAHFLDDGSVTRVGRWLRRWSLDELPQLWNVAKGEMSIVGPRPTFAYQVERYTPRQLGRLSVRPGITGLAQTRGRTAIAWEQRIELDLVYLERQSPWLDARILLATIGAVISSEGIDQTRRDDPLASVEHELESATGANASQTSLGSAG